MAEIFDSDWVSKSPPAIGKAKESALLVRVAFLTARECADAALRSVALDAARVPTWASARCDAHFDARAVLPPVEYAHALLALLRSA